MKVKSESEAAQPCPTPSDPMSIAGLQYSVYSKYRQVQYLPLESLVSRGL